MDTGKSLPPTTKFFGYRGKAEDELMVHNQPPSDVSSQSPRLTLSRRKFFTLQESNEEGGVDKVKEFPAFKEDSGSDEKCVPSFPPRFNTRRRGSLDTELAASLANGTQDATTERPNVDIPQGNRRRGSLGLLKEGIESAFSKVAMRPESREKVISDSGNIDSDNPLKNLDLLSSIRQFHEQQHMQSSLWTDSALDPAEEFNRSTRKNKRCSLPIIYQVPSMPMTSEGHLQKPMSSPTDNTEVIQKTSLLEKVSAVCPPSTMTSSSEPNQAALPNTQSNTEKPRGPISSLLFGSTAHAHKTPVKKRDMNAFTPSSW